jgi:hypothetical protein
MSSIRKMVILMGTTRDMHRTIMGEEDTKIWMEVGEGMGIRRRTRIILHNKNTMGSLEEVGECLHQIVEEVDHPWDRLQQIQLGEDMIKEVVDKGEDIQMLGHLWDEEGGQLH